MLEEFSVTFWDTGFPVVLGLVIVARVALRQKTGPIILGQSPFIGFDLV